MLVIIFFLTLNYNNKVLYAPSDYQDENNYIKINSYDKNTQKKIQIKIPNDPEKDQLLNLNNKIETLEKHIKLLQTQTIIDTSIEPIFLKYSFLVTHFHNVDKFLLYMKKNNINFDIYTSPRSFDNDSDSLEDHRAIWLGRDIDIKTVKFVLQKAKEFYPHLKYISLSDDNEPEDSHDQIYIGGSTHSALEFGCLPISDNEFEKIQSIENLEDLHKYIKSFSK